MKTACDIYNYDIDPDSDSAAAYVLRFVGKERNVIEIGAGPGSISRALVSINRCRVTALEVDPKCIEVLRGFCESVCQSDLNDPGWIADLPSHAFDAVVIADVLEHLIDPWTTLRLAVGLLNENGSVVVSLPHASHAAIIACLLNNDFDYREWGLLDRTHIRFFSMKNMQALFAGAGLKIADFAFVLRHPTDTELADAWAALRPRARAVLQAGEFANVYQVVVRAVPIDRDPARPGRVLFAHPVSALSKLKIMKMELQLRYPRLYRAARSAYRAVRKSGAGQPDSSRDG